MDLLVLGANSDMAQAIARKFAQAEKANLYLASRNLEILKKRAKDIQIRYQVEAKPLFFDATDYASHPQFYENLDPKPDGVVLSFGYLGDQEKGQQSFKELEQIVATNFLGAARILEIIATDFAERGHGFIIGISSVAGERGRQGNYIYGAAKSGLTVYLSGLRNRLFNENVRVITVLPGFVLTRMTENLDLPPRLTAEVQEVADDVYGAYKKGKDIVYCKWFWRWIMFIIKSIPERVFKRMRL
ncbi:MAG: SDR family oxidoreductase [Syntrophobacterales bacterium]|jgi:decaprenylphospho-beta-D-erythro-pentofuranosid-2-ulose 2-reductase